MGLFVKKRTFDMDENNNSDEKSRLPGTQIVDIFPNEI